MEKGVSSIETVVSGEGEWKGMFGNDKVIGLGAFGLCVMPKIRQEFRTSTPSRNRSTYARKMLC